MAFGFGMGFRFGSRQGGGGGPVTQYALRFDGVDDVCSAGRVITAEPGADEDFAAAVRFYYEDAGAGKFPRPIANLDGGGTNMWSFTFLDDGNMFPQIIIGGTNEGVYTTDPPFDAWHNLAIIRRSGEFYYYVNGTEFGPRPDFTNTGAISDAGMVLMLGLSCEGLIEKAAYWADTAVTEGSLDAWFASTSVTTGSPTHAWAINEGEGSTVADAVGSADFTITGATWEQI